MQKKGENEMPEKIDRKDETRFACFMNSVAGSQDNIEGKGVIVYVFEMVVTIFLNS